MTLKTELLKYQIHMLQRTANKDAQTMAKLKKLSAELEAELTPKLGTPIFASSDQQENRLWV